MTYSCLFSGFGGTGLGFKSAGLTPINHFELDPRIAEVGQANSAGKYIVGDVCDVDWHRYEAPDVLGASPVCKNASVANANASESDADIQTALATVRALKTWRPRVFFLENVWGYRDFEAFKLILRALDDEGYSYDHWHLNAANFGVPQTRKRLILVGVRERGHHGGKLKLCRPEPTHARQPVASLFGSLERWNGWYDAIEDLIPSLPESQFAAWQIKRLKKLRWVPGAWLIGDQKSTGNESVVNVARDRPAMTVRAGENGGGELKAYLVYEQNASREMTARRDSSPAATIGIYSPKHPEPKVGLVDGCVLSVTSRALARFQSVPNEFQLSGHRKLDGIGVGNMVPPLLAQRVMESILEQIR